MRFFTNTVISPYSLLIRLTLEIILFVYKDNSCLHQHMCVEGGVLWATKPEQSSASAGLGTTPLELKSKGSQWEQQENSFPAEPAQTLTVAQSRVNDALAKVLFILQDVGKTLWQKILN